jgi:hypothetical protein
MLVLLFGSRQCSNWFWFNFRRLVLVQQLMRKEIKTFFDHPPMQRSASRLGAVKAEMANR